MPTDGVRAVESVEPAVTIARSVWLAARAAHRARVQPRVDDRLRRASRREKHPVHDFLFEYYSFRPSHLMRWSPGFGVLLEAATREEIEWPEFEARNPVSLWKPGFSGARQKPGFQSETGFQDWILPPASFPQQRVSYLEWAIRHLEATVSREPAFSCFGLHEWAMFYRDPNVRHTYVPLRMSRADIDSFVESQSLRCTHYDAFRFFTQEATPRNRIALTRVTSTDHEQPGCIHANMDLYRFAYKIAPFGMSELLADAFELAEAARAVDMRASPYDLSGYGYAAIPIETREGREEYVEEQRRLAERAVPLRERMLEEYVRLLNAIASR